MKTDLIERLRDVYGNLTSGAIEQADLDGMAFTVREAADRIAALETEAVKHERALLTVQNAAKTLASARGTELEHLRQNHAIDHKLRAEHDSLIERDALMTDALLKAEARIAALEAEASEGERRGLEAHAEAAFASVRTYLEGQAPSTCSGGIRNSDLRALIPEAPAQPELASAAANQLSGSRVGEPARKGNTEYGRVA